MVIDEMLLLVLLLYHNLGGMPSISVGLELPHQLGQTLNVVEHNPGTSPTPIELKSTYKRETLKINGLRLSINSTKIILHIYLISILSMCALSSQSEDLELRQKSELEFGSCTYQLSDFKQITGLQLPHYKMK